MSLLSGQLALADNTPSSDPYDDGISGYYVSVDAGYAWTHDGSNPLLAATINHKGGATFAGHMGYSFNPYFAFEIGYRHLPSTSGNGVSVSRSAFDGTLTIRAPFKGGFDLFGKLGMAYIDSSIKAGGVSANAYVYRPTFSVGADYHVTPNITINTQWTRILGKANAYDGFAQSTGANLPIIDTLTTGIAYRF